MNWLLKGILVILNTHRRYFFWLRRTNFLFFIFYAADIYTGLRQGRMRKRIILMLFLLSFVLITQNYCTNTTKSCLNDREMQFKWKILLQQNNLVNSCQDNFCQHFEPPVCNHFFFFGKVFGDIIKKYSNSLGLTYFIHLYHTGKTNFLYCNLRCLD